MILNNKLILTAKEILPNKCIFDQALALPPLVEPLKQRLPEVPGNLSNGQPGTCVKDRGLELCPAFRGGKEDGEEERVPHGRGSETGPVNEKEE